MLNVSNQLVFAGVEEILYRLRKETGYLKDIKITGDKALITCPYHSSGNENSPSCIINFNKTDRFEAGDFSCFACKEHGSISKLVGKCFNENEIFGAKWILNIFGGSEISDRKSLFRVPMRIDKSQNLFCDDDLDSYRFIHPYMYERHLTDDLIETFDIGYDGENITFPIKDDTGNVLFVAKRSVVGKKFDLPKNIDKPLCYLYEVSKYFPDTKEIYVVESLFNALTLWKYGKPTIALLGTGTKDQLQKLNRLPYRTLIIALDNDPAGNLGYLRIKNSIRDKFISKLTINESGKDINDLGDKTWEEFKKCICISRD